MELIKGHPIAATAVFVADKKVTGKQTVIENVAQIRLP
jgi:hypothetical protein